MTRIGIEQYGHTWHAEVEGGTGLNARKKHVRAGDFPEMIAAVVQAWAEINDREPIVFLRSTGEILRGVENEAVARREKLLDERAAAHNRTYDDLGNEEPPTALRRYPPRPEQNPEIPQSVHPSLGPHPEEQTRAEMDADFAPHHKPQPPFTAADVSYPSPTGGSALAAPHHTPPEPTVPDDLKFTGKDEFLRTTEGLAREPRRGPGRPRKEPTPE
jgi:hypothetical protein